MPLVPQDRSRLGTIASLPVATQIEQEAPGALDTAAAALRQNNIASSLYNRLTEPSVDTAPVPSYDALDDIEGYEDHAERFIRAQSPAETAQIKSRISSELSDRETIQAAGGWGLAASMASAVIDPATLISMAIPAGGATKGVQIAKMLGSQLAVDSASELALHSLQETRTGTESAINIGASALLTGVLGSVLVKAPAREVKAAHKAVETEWQGSTVGAASRGSNTTLAQESIGKGGQWLAKTIGKIAPLSRVMTSTSKTARQVAQQLAETPYALTKNEEGIASEAAVETLTKQYDALMAKSVMSVDDAYKTYRNRVKAEGQKPLSIREFNEEVGMAMSRNDESVIAEAAQMAKWNRTNIIDPLTKQLQKNKLLPEALETVGARSYRPRMYDVPKIKANLTEWKNTLVEHFTREGADLGEAKQAAADVTNMITGSIRGQVSLDPMVVVKAGPLKERTLTVPDELLHPFLVNDAEQLMQRYIRSVAPQLELSKKFGEVDMRAQIQAIEDEFTVMEEAATSNKAKEAIRNEKDSVLKDIVGMRDRLTGQIGQPADPESLLVRGQRLIRDYSYVRLLGSQVFSSAADVGRIITRHGMKKTTAALGKFVTNIAKWKPAREDAKRMAIGLDWTLNTRGQSLGDIGEFASTRPEQISQAFTNNFSRVTGMATWNSTMKFLTTAIEQDVVLELAEKSLRGTEISGKKLSKLAQGGIDQDMLQRIGKEFQTHGERDGMRRARSELWTDKEAATIFEASMLKAADTVILQKGIGDTPLLMSGELAKTIFQFKGFGMAAVNRLLIPAAQGLAKGDLAMLNGLMVMLALGAARYVAKQWTSDQPIDTKPSTIMREAVDGSGLTAYLVEPYDLAAGLSGGILPRFSRYTDRAPIESALGPTVGTLSDLYATGQAVTTNGLSESDVHKLRKLAPYQNLFYLRRAINAMEEASADALGAAE